MTTDIERLVLSLDANVSRLDKSMAKAVATFDKQSGSIEKRWKKTNKNLAQSSFDLQRDFRNGIATIGVGLIVRDTVNLADAWTKVGNKIGLAGVEGDRLAATQNTIADIALKTRTQIEATADLYSRMLRTSDDLGASEREVARATELVNKALAGAEGSERASAITQLGQGLGSARLQGDELKAILENSRPLAEAIANEFGVAVGELKQLGADGELESKRVFRAILAAAPEIEAAYKRTTGTVDDAFTNLRTRLVQYIGTNNTAIGASNQLAAAINFVADNLDAFADAAIIATAVLAGGFAGAAIANAITSMRAFIVTLAATQGALTATTIASGITARAVLALRTALAAAGGPLGIILAAVAGAIAYLLTKSNDLQDGLGEVDRITSATTTTMKSYQDAIDEAARATGREAEELRELAKARREAAQAFLDQARTEARAAQIKAAAAVKDAETLKNAAEKAATKGALGMSTQETIDVLAAGVPGTKQNKQKEALEKAAEVLVQRRKLVDDLEGQVAALEEIEQTLARADSSGGGSSKSKGPSVADLERIAALSLARLQNDIARVDVLEDELEIARRAKDYDEAGLSAAAAELKATKEVKAERVAISAQREKALGMLRSEMAIDVARSKNQVRLAESLEDELELRRLIDDLNDQGVNSTEAERIARGQVDALRHQREELRQLDILERSLQNARDQASGRLDEREANRLNRIIDAMQRMRDLQDLGFGEDAARKIAASEVDTQHLEEIRGQFRGVFRDAFRAAMEGDLSQFFEDYFRDRFYNAMNKVLDRLADSVFDAVTKVFPSIFGLGQDVLGSASSITAASVTGLGATASTASASITGLGGQSLSTSGTLAILAKAAQTAAAALAAIHTEAGKEEGGTGHDIISSLIKLGTSAVTGGSGPNSHVAAKLFMPSEVSRIGSKAGSAGVTFNDNRKIEFTGTSEELQQLKQVMDADMRTRKVQIVSAVNDAIDRRAIS